MMNNRFAWILIILWVIIFWYFYYVFFYLADKLEEEKLENITSSEEKKEISLEAVDKKVVIKSNTDKIEDLKNNKKYFRVIDVEWKKFYFSIINNSLHLNSDSKLVWVFNLVNNKDLEVKKIYNSDDYYIIVGNNKYIYNNILWDLYDIDLNIDIDYIKKSNNNYLLKTINWIFIYSKIDKDIEYFHFFNDFIDYNWWYIGIISKDDNTRINNLDIELDLENAIYFYNPDTKEKYIIYESDKILNKIYLENDNIFFEDNKENKYELKNYIK